MKKVVLTVNEEKIMKMVNGDLKLYIYDELELVSILFYERKEYSKYSFLNMMLRQIGRSNKEGLNALSLSLKKDITELFLDIMEKSLVNENVNSMKYLKGKENMNIMKREVENNNFDFDAVNYEEYLDELNKKLFCNNRREVKQAEVTNVCNFEKLNNMSNKKFVSETNKLNNNKRINNYEERFNNISNELKIENKEEIIKEESSNYFNFLVNRKCGE